MEKEKIRPLYSELQGYLAQAPEAKNTSDGISSSQVWSQYNGCVNLVQKITEKDYSRFEIQAETANDSVLVRVIAYRQKLGGLVAALHGEYFSDESAPFSGMPNTIIQQTQHQNQSVNIIMLLSIQSKIDEKLSQFPEGSKEKSFLQKLKGTLSGISDVTQLLAQLTKIAKDFGLSVNDLSKIFC